MKKKMDNKTKIFVATIIILLLGFIIYYNKTNRLQTDLNISKQNGYALSDSLRVSKNKLGQLEFSKYVLVSDKDSLSKLNSDLAKELAKENGKVNELTKYIVKINNEPIDSIPTKLIEYPNGDKGLDWVYEKHYDKDNYRLISGTSNFQLKFGGYSYELIPLDTKITKDEIGFNVIQGLRETSDGKVEMFVRSDYPEFALKDLSSVIIDPKTHPVLQKFTTPSEKAGEARKKRFGLGVFAGYGGYIDNTNKTAGMGVQIGIGLSYNLITF